MSSPEIPNYTEKAFEAVDETVETLEEDIDVLEDFREEVLKQPVTQKTGRQSFAEASSGSDVIDLYDEMFFHEDRVKDRVRVFADEYDLSLPAADLLDEFANVPDMDNNHALQLVRKVNSGNLNKVVQQQFGKAIEYPAKLRGKIIEDAEVELDSLDNYRRQIGEVKEKLYTLNEENPLPVGLDDASDVIDELESMSSRVKQLKDRRLHELGRREELQQGYFISQEAGVYEDESFGRPVLQELDELDEALDEAYENLAVKF